MLKGIQRTKLQATMVIVSRTETSFVLSYRRPATCLHPLPVEFGLLHPESVGLFPQLVDVVLGDEILIQRLLLGHFRGPAP